MQFVYPAFLIALSTLAIPIILHLFYFRRFKKVYFTNVHFLKEVKEETSARNKLKNLLVLLMRLLAVAFLVLAFAQPFIPQENVEVKKGNKAVSVYIDNSFSMSAQSQDVALIEKAKQRGREIINAYQVEDQFQVLTNDFEGRHQRLVSKEDALELIDEIEISPTVKSMSTVVNRQKQLLEDTDSESKTSYLISDFQRNITDINQYKDTTVDLNLIPLQAVQERNISIDSAWFDSPVQMLQQNNPLMVRITNRGDQDIDNVRLALTYEGQTKPLGTLTIPKNASVIDTVNFTLIKTGWHTAQLNITDYPIQFDDNYFLTFYVAEQINILTINDDQENPYLNASFRGLDYFQLINQNSSNLDYSRFRDFQLIILNGIRSVSTGLSFELQQFVKNGGNLLVFPNPNSDLASYQSFLSGFPANELVRFEDQLRKVSQINTEEFVFNNVFENTNENIKLPTTQGNYQLTNYVERKEERLLIYRDGSTYLSKYQVGNGHLYLCVAPLDENSNDLVKNAEVFIPLIYKTAISSGTRRRIAYVIGQDELLQANHQNKGGDLVYKLKGQELEFIPEQRIVGSRALFTLGNQIADAGFYDLFINQEDILGKFAFNFDRKESNLQYYSPNDLEGMSEGRFNVINLMDTAVLTAEIEERSQGVVLWRWCIILMLVFLGIESLILRFWKT